jgi:phospholipase/lecithinase/hemolysin
MPMRKIALLSFYVTLLFAAAASAFALDFSRFNHLVVFGDSLSDNGNLLAILEAQGIKPPQPPQPPFPPYGETFDGSGLIFPGSSTDRGKYS